MNVDDSKLIRVIEKDEVDIQKEISIACKIGQKRGKSRLITTNAKLCILVRRRTKYFEIRVHSHWKHLWETALESEWS
jgi:hypothetical protein